MEDQKARELTQIVVNKCASVGIPLEERDAAQLVSSYANIEAPVYREPTSRELSNSEETMVFGPMIEQVEVLKPGNIFLDMDGLIIALSGAGLALATATTPLVAVIATLGIVYTLKKQARVELTDTEAAVVLTLHELTANKNPIPRTGLRDEVNATRKKHGYEDPISEQMLKRALHKLDEIGTIERVPQGRIRLKEKVTATWD
jgi:hypothetical protein